jgi:hypothetical protein
MRRFLTALLAALTLCVSPACAHAFTGAQKQILLGGVQSWALPGSSLDLNFALGGGSCTVARVLVGCSSVLTISRASDETSLLPSSASGATYYTFPANTLAIVPGVGLQVYASATNYLLNSNAPVTQTTGSLATGSYTLWVNGSGSAAVSAGTATITGAGSATNGTPVTFTVTVAGTCVVTVTGSLNAFQLESGPFGTPLIVTAGVTATRAADTIKLSTSLKGIFQAAQGTIFASVQMGGLVSSGNQIIGSFSNGTVNNFALLIGHYSTTNNTRGSTASGGSADGDAVIGSMPTPYTRYRAAMAWGGGSVRGVVGNGAGATDASETSPVALTSFTVGSADYIAAAYMGGFIEEIGLFNFGATIPQMKAYTGKP